MTLKTFKKKLEKIIEDEGEFIVWTKETMTELEDDQFTICGKDEKEVFTFVILKV